MPPTVRLDFSPLRQERERLGVTREFLAREVGIHWHTLLRIEGNQTAPKAWHLVAIARRLGRPYSSLFKIVEQ